MRKQRWASKIFKRKVPTFNMELQESNNLEVFRKRIEVLVGARIKGGDAKKSAEIQDSIRRKVGRWNGAKEIIKWRDLKAASF